MPSAELHKAGRAVKLSTPRPTRVQESVCARHTRRLRKRGASPPIARGSRQTDISAPGSRAWAGRARRRADRKPTGGVPDDALDHVAFDERRRPFTPPATAEEAREYIRANRIEFLFAQFVDMHGKPNAKLVPASHLDDLLTEGAGFAGFAAGDIGQRPNSTRTWRDARRAQPHAAAVPAGASRASPATCTSRARSGRTARARSCAASSTAPRRSATSSRSAAELEYFLVRQEEDGSIELADPLDTLDQPCYDMRALTRNLDFVLDRSRATSRRSAGTTTRPTTRTPTASSSRTSSYADALTTADRAIFFRYMVESMAQERGLIATFMPKPFAHLTGNGCHFHMSLWKDGENVFEADPSDDPHGMGLSETAYQFIGGLKAHAKAYIAVTAPTVTSYKRLVVEHDAERLDMGKKARN